jgi:fumarate hydratase class II
MGEVKVPQQAYYGAQTQRAIDNFPISQRRFPREFIHAIGLIKMAATQVNRELGLLNERVTDPIVRAAQEVVDGKFDADFAIDIY